MEFIKTRLESLIDGIILAAVIGVGVAVWSLISKLPPPIIFVAGLATFAAIIFIWIQLGIWRERTKKKISKLSDEELGETIHKWISKPIYKYKIQSNVRGDAFFSFTIENPYKRGVEIIRLKDEPSVIRLGVNIVSTDELVSKISALSELKQAEIASGLIIELSRLGVSWSKVKPPLKEFVIEDAIVISDELTEFYLLQHIRFMDRVVIIANEYVGMMTRQYGKKAF